MLAISAKGQTTVYHPFPDSNAIWVGHYKNNDTSNIYSFGLIGDTIIDSFQYNKIYVLHDSVLTINGSTYFGAIRENGKKVYYRYMSCTHDVLLYDFTKQINDTIFSVYSDFEITWCLDSTPFFLVINSIDSILINGSYRKVFHFENDTLNWIEGIGSTKGLLEPIPPGVMGNYDWNLVCFFQNDELLYHNQIFGSCFKSNSGIGENFEKRDIEINIFPNPSNGSLTVDFANMKNLKEILLQDLLGKIVFRQTINNQRQIKIDNLPSGAYILTIIDNDYIKINKKIISSP